ncbi:MAG TPA: polymer-forming cytoskeletal protein [Thermoanaerobaculia bacterium]|nr:polymer-forming cytoskeletal protein [Thermoanaerobaculia bacterium]
MPCARWRWLRGAVLGGALALALPAASSARQPPDAAVRLDRGSQTTRQIVAIGRDLVVDGVARRHAVVLDGDARVAGTVEGDLVVLGGDVILQSSGRVAGDVYAFGGEIRSEDGSSIGGRAVAFPDAPATWLLLVEGPSIGLDPFSPLVLGAKLALLAAWMAASLLLVITFPRALASTAREVDDEPFRCFFAGLVAVATAVLAVVLISGLASVVVGIPLILVAAASALVLKLWGTVAVFLTLGVWLLRRLGRGRSELLEAIVAGLVALGVLKLLPWVGVVAWTAATLIGIGAALRTKLGSREPWLVSSGAGALPVRR